jgi:hypothetical protein
MAPTSATDESTPFVSSIPPSARVDKIIDPTATNPSASFQSDDERRRRIFRFLEGSFPFESRYEEFTIFLILLWVITSVSSVFLSTSTYHVSSDACDSWCDAVWAGIGSTFVVKTSVVGAFTIDYILRIFTADLIDPTKYSGFLGRLRFMLSFLALVDLISIVPFYIDAFHVPNTELGSSAIFLRMFRLLRMAHAHQPKPMSVVASETSSFGGRRESPSCVINAVGAAPNLVSGIDQSQHQMHWHWHWSGTMGVQYQSTTNQEGWSSITLHSISAMPQYVQKSFEELRLEDYTAGNRGAKGLTATAPLPGLGGYNDGQGKSIPRRMQILNAHRVI